MTKDLNFIQKIILFLRKEEKKIFSVFFLILKVLLSLFLTIIIPICLFLFFISIRPREITKINNSVLLEIKKINGINVEFSEALLSIDKYFNFVYIIKNLQLKNKNYDLILPNIKIRVNIFNILFNKKIINDINIADINFSLNKQFLSNIFNIDNKNTIEKKPEEILYNLFDRIYKYKLPIEKITIEKSVFQLDKENTIYINHFDISIKEYYGIKKTLNILFSFKINKDGDSIVLKNKCNFGLSENVNCEFNLLNIYSTDLQKISKKYNIFSNYILNSDVNVNLNGVLYLKNYINLESLKFTFLSKSGNFYFKEIFTEKIFYNDLIIKGEIENKFQDIKITDFKTDIIFKEYDKPVNLSLIFNKYFDKQNKIYLNIKVSDAKINKLNVLWPIFLNQKDIRKWVVSHIYDGDIPEAFVEMDFIQNNNEYNLNKLYSEVNFKESNIDYDDSFPAFNNVNGKAIFTEKFMDILINKANLDETLCTNAKIHSDFIKDIVSLDITGNTKGNPYELFYFINNKNREATKNLILDYFNGKASTKVNISIPLIDKLSLKDISLNIKGNIEKNNSFLFNNDSTIEFDVVKLKNDFNFKTKLNLLNSEIYFPFISLNKEKKIEQSISLDVIVNLNSNIVQLANIKNLNNNLDYLKFEGEGVVDLKFGNLSNLTFKSVQLDKSFFEIIYSIIENKDALFIVNSNYILLSKNLKNDYLKFIDSFIYNKIFNEEKKLNSTFKFESNIDKIELDYNSIFVNNKFISNEKEINFSSNYNKNNTIKIINTIYNQKDIKYQTKILINNVGSFIDIVNMTDKVMGGDLEISGTVNNQNEFKGNINIKNNFYILLSNILNKDGSTNNYITNKFLKEIFENESIPKEIKNNLQQKHSLKFHNLEGKISLDKNKIIRLKNIIVFGNLIGMDINVNGKIYLNNGKIDLSGLIIPAGKLNRLFFIDRIPLLNELIGGKNGALFALTYSFYKENYKSDYEFKLNTGSLLTPGILRNILY